MSTPSLRALAKAYSDNLIDRKQYVRERRELIDGIICGDIEIVAYESPRVVQEPDFDRTFSDGDTTLELPHIEAQQTELPPALNSTGIIIGIVILAIIAIVAWFTLAPVPESSAPAQVAQPAGDKDVDGRNPARELLVEFLDENQWRPERIDRFTLDWLSVPAAARAGLSDDPLIHRFNDIIAQKILEEKALLELGDREEALAAQRQLLDLAAALSAYDERFARLEDEWQEAHGRFVAEEQESKEYPSESTSATLPGPHNLAETVQSASAATTETKNVAPFASEEPPPVREQPAAESDIGEATPPTQTQQPGAALAELTPSPLPAPAQEPSGEPLLPATALAESTPTPLPTTTQESAVEPSPAVAPAAESTPTPAAHTADTTNAEFSATGTEANNPAIKRPRQRSSGCRAALAKQRRPYCRDTLTEKLKGPALVVLPDGQVQIGGKNPEEQPSHVVTIARPFAIGIYEISFGEFQAFCAATKRNCPIQPWTDPKLPVVNVPWTLAMEYTQWLSEVSGAVYRLPSEAEWEYAARAGTTTAYPFGDEILPTHARFSFRAIETVPLASRDHSVNRNKFRLYHMVGNVREWVIDVWHETYTGAPDDGDARTGPSGQRVVRGGSFSDGADRIRSASRMHLAENAGDSKTGFRVVRLVE